ncbi:lisH and WD40 domain-containing protein mahjong isoform X2 [Haematobia irritans]|uniref:lisH and WD40 domain-containing protein mahjong isoform X2 n=1 Tax=Haematobia irritans TaxID=7368 RepID=UPI003F4FC9E5
MSNNTEDLPAVGVETDNNTNSDGQSSSNSNNHSVQPTQDQQEEASTPLENGNVAIDNEQQAEENMEIDHQAEAPNGNGDGPPAVNGNDSDVDVEAVENAAVPAAAINEPFYGFEESEPNLEEKDMPQVLQFWESKHTQSGFDPVPALKRLAEIFEKEKEIYMRKDPDPFDERHPYRTDPSCQFGFLLKQLFRKDIFMKKLVNDYLRDNYFTRQNIQKSSYELNILALRLILVIMPGLETSAVFQVEFDNLINRIYSWAEDSIEPLQSYATGLLAAAMEVTDIAVTFRELNTRLVPKMIKRLHMLQAIHKTILQPSTTGESVSANNSIESEAGLNNSSISGSGGMERILPAWMAGSAPQSPQRLDDSASNRLQNNSALDTFVSSSNLSTLLENSRDAFPTGSAGRYYKKMYIPIHPPSAETSQMLILRYLTTMGEYQEFLGLIFEHNAMQLIFGYIENLDRRDTCLAFEALKYLASLLCHKKFALDFITNGGLERLLKVPRPSIAATGVSITLYYLAYSEDAMERICTMPKYIITDLVRYALWILGHSYDSGKCHATMFFGLSFQFKVMLDEFDAQDGLRKLYNVISVLKILNPSNNNDENNELNEDVECASRQIVRHVCVALKRYMESHLFYKYNSFMCQQFPVSSEFNRNITKATKTTMEQINEQIRNLQENTSVRAHWAPVDQLLKLGGITLLLKIIAFSYDWNNSGRSETVRSALDVLSICCVIPRVYAAYCDVLELPSIVTTSGIYSILGAAAGDIVPDADVQKSALAVLCNCVCSPIARKEPNTLMKCFGSSKKVKHNNKYSEELVEKVWESVCSNNGIIVLLSLMQIKTPITDSDCIRGMACRVLAGLARWERVKQIIGKLPLFASGQIQTLMRDPILQEKRAEHVIFQKYALELLEQVSGKTKPFSHQLDPTLANIHKANVIAQTKISYNEHQLHQLIYEHLESKGLTQTAQMLQKEAGLQLPSTTMKSFHQSPFDYKVLPTNSIARNRLRSRMQDVNQAISSASNQNVGTSTMPTTITTMGISKDSLNDSFSDDQAANTITPIKLVKKTEKIPTTLPPTSTMNTSSAAKSLQKQISVTEANNILDINSPPPFSNSVTLSTIVTEYLTNQHALCNNPMTTCPQFDLLTPHKCPDPKPNRILGDNLNVTTRFFRSQAGYNAQRLNRRFIHSHFAPWKTIRSNDYNDVIFSSCHIVPNSDILLAGTHQGGAKVYNINHGTELFSARCHSYIIDSILSNRTGDLVLTSVSWRSPLSCLWSIKDNDFVSKIEFIDEFYCEFSKLNQDKVIGTLSDACTIYDISTGQKISTFTPTLGNQYTKNRATFCPTDELVLSSGVLWDVRSGKEIHKFDKLNQSLSGVFHPNGLEIISNTEVWDLRTFHLLQTVPVLDQCLIKFSPMHVMYGIRLEMENRSDYDDSTTYDTSFKVLDSYDYSSISTIDAKRSIFDLSVSGNGSLIALVEDQPSYESKPETFVKIYCVGMKKTEQDEEEDECEESDEDNSDSDESNNEEEDSDEGDDDSDDSDDDDDDDDGEGDGDSSDDDNWIDIMDDDDDVAQFAILD